MRVGDGLGCQSVAEFRAYVAALQHDQPFHAFALIMAAGDFPSLHDPSDMRQARQDARVLVFLEHDVEWSVENSDA
jgi:hypothetical protein